MTDDRLRAQLNQLPMTFPQEKDENRDLLFIISVIEIHLLLHDPVIP